MRKNVIASGAVAGALLLGGTGAALVLPSLAAAANPTATPTTGATTTGNGSGSTGTDTRPAWGGRGFGMGGRGFGGAHEAVSDASVAARAIGITETQLAAELTGGKTVAQVAAAHGVAAQTVIDALVADRKAEVAAALKAGTIAQAQADRQLAGATQLATDQANGTGFGPGGRGFGMGGRGMGMGPGGRPNGDRSGASPTASPSTGTGTSG